VMGELQNDLIWGNYRLAGEVLFGITSKKRAA